jgi:hypothetical protein
MKHPTRRVRALQRVYVGHVLRAVGEEFSYSGPASAALFLELDAGDTSPVAVSVPREEDAPAPESNIDDIL